MAGRIILVRHGQTHNNVRHLLDTRPPGAELTEQGRRQALDVGHELAQYSGERLAQVYSSIVLRAQQTAVLATSTFEKARDLEEGSVPWRWFTVSMRWMPVILRCVATKKPTSPTPRRSTVGSMGIPPQHYPVVKPIRMFSAATNPPWTRSWTAMT